jgi:hypothetical protein
MLIPAMIRMQPSQASEPSVSLASVKPKNAVQTSCVAAARGCAHVCARNPGALDGQGRIEGEKR